jgi:hypothetical protein
MSDEQPSFRIYRCTFKHLTMNTEHTYDIEVPSTSSDPLSGDEGFAWRHAERAVEEEQGRKGIWLRDLFRMRITRVHL